MVEGRVGQRRVARSPGEEFVLLEVRGADTTGKLATPVNLALVIDRSGSMKGTRLRNAIGAATGAVNRLRDGDVVSVVTFDTRTEVVVAPTTVGPGTRERIASDIGRIALGGDTCISCGIDEGMAELERTPGMVNRMIVLSDGDANHGVRDVPGFRNMAQRARDRGISVTTIGVDVDYNEKILSAIAQESNGGHYFVENDASLERVFAQEAESLTSTVASSTEAAIELPPGIELDRVFDRSFRKVGNQIIVPLGAFARGEVKTVLLKVRMTGAALGAQPVANVELTYRDLVNDTQGKCAGKLAAEITSDTTTDSEMDSAVQDRIERSQTAATLREANNLAAQGKFDEARRRLSQQQQAIVAAAGKAKKAKPTARGAEVEKDLDRQLAVIDEANRGFATPPPVAANAAPGAPAPAPARAVKAATKQNEQNMLDVMR
jgi:Ca-activated chloride channel family protein